MTTTTHTPPAEIFAGNLFTWHVATPDLSVAEVIAQPGGEPALHVHEREDETYYVISGELTFQRGEERFDAGPGDVVFLPRGIEHGFALRGERAQLLLVATPGGIEVPFLALSEPALDGDVPAPPAGPPSDEEVGAMVVAFGAHGIEFTGPPLPALLAG
jgi:mannose-6-phosphate isomerase-like protein (cupin superfamily)